MKTMKRVMKKSKRGLVLPIIAAIALCLALLGLGVLQLGFGSRLMATRTMASVSARAAADAGVTRALYEMNALFDSGLGWLSPLPPDVVDQPLGNSNATFSYQIGPIDTHPATAEPYRVITSIGKLGSQESTVYAVLGMRNMFDYGLIVTDFIDLKAHNLIDGYNTNLGQYTLPPNYTNSHAYIRIGTTSIAPNKILLNQGSEITGDVLVGIGGDVDEVIRETPVGGSITGSWYNLPEPWSFEPIPVPDCGPNLGNLNTTFTLGQIGQVTYYKYQNINLPNSSVLDVLGEVYLHVTGDITINNSAEIRVNGVPMDPLSWSSITIYLNGGLRVHNSGLINNITEKPRNFKLFGIGTSNGGELWRIDNSGNYYGVYYGPNAIIITANGAEFYGSISGRQFELKLDGKLHYDHDLSGLIGYDTGFGIDRLWEKSDFVTAGL